jgi:hypothetical protein
VTLIVIDLEVVVEGQLSFDTPSELPKVLVVVALSCTFNAVQPHLEVLERSYLPLCSLTALIAGKLNNVE